MFRVDFAAAHAGVLDVPRCVFEDAVGFPDVDELLTHRAGVDNAVVGQTVADGLDQVSSARRDVAGEFVGTMVRVALIVLCSEGLKLLEKSLLVSG